MYKTYAHVKVLSSATKLGTWKLFVEGLFNYFLFYFSSIFLLTNIPWWMFKKNCIVFKKCDSHLSSFYPFPWSDRLPVYSLRDSWKDGAALETGLEPSAVTLKL